MSSFRIDRQYVSFQTAETQPVFATSLESKPKQVLSGDIESYGGDIGKLYNEIYEKLLQEHAEQAETMLSKASAEAQEIVENARKQANELVGRAKTDAAKLRDELVSTIESTAHERKCLEEQVLLKLEASLQNEYRTLIDGMQGEIIALVIEIVRKVIGIKLSQSDEIFLGLVRDALEQLKQTGSVVIRVGPEDYARYFGAERSDEIFDTGEIKVAIVEEPDFSPGDLIVESEGEIIDLSVDRQIALIEKAFQN